MALVLHILSACHKFACEIPGTHQVRLENKLFVRIPEWVLQSRAICIDLLPELDDLVVLVDLRASVAGKRAVSHGLVLLCPAAQGGVLDLQLFGKPPHGHVAAEDDLGGGDLELPVVPLSLLGHHEHLSPLTWCPKYPMYAVA